MFSRLSLSQKLISIIILLLVVVFSTISVIISKSVNTGVLSLQKQTLTRETVVLTDIVELMVDEQLRIAALGADRNSIRQELRQKTGYAQSERYAQLVKSQGPIYDDVFIVDETGSVVSATKSSLTGTDMRDREFWRGISSGKKRIFESYPQKSESGAPVSIVAAAIHDQNNTFLGAFCMAVNFGTFAKEHIINQKIGEGGYPYIVTDKGVVIAHPTKETNMQDLSSSGFIKEILASSGRGFQDYVWKGERKIQAFEKIETIPWFVCINTPRNELIALARSLTLTILIISGLTVLILSFVMYLVINTILLKRFHRFRDVFGQGSKGDLTVRVDDSNKDELGSLANHFNGFIGNIQSLLKELRASITDISGYSQELSSTATEMASTAEELSSQSTVVASASEESTTNINTISSAAEQMSSNLETVATSMEELTASVNEGAQNTQRESRLANEAKNAAEETAHTMSRLETAAQKIGKVVEIIRDIADQTNLLALNATIEAASAGEAGKGFAVVANEVKELAKQSSQATDEIANQIGEIQSSTLDAVEAIKGITTRINEVNSISEMIASSIEEQTATVHEAAKNVTEASGAASEIARNVQESASGLQEISSNIQGVNSAIGNTSSAASNVEKRSVDLSEMSGQLNEKISKFKV